MSININDELQFAINFYQQNNYKKALTLLHKFNQKNKKPNPISLQLEAVCYAKEGEYSAAAILIKHVLSLPLGKLEKEQARKIASEINLAINKQNELEAREVKIQLNGELSDLNIKGENKKVVSLTNKMMKLLISMGAKFNPNLLFVEQGGNLSINSSQKENQIHLQVPLQCMPLLVDYNLSIAKNGLISVKVKGKPINPAAIPVMKLMVELFNVTNKVEEWKRVYPFLVFEHAPDIIKVLFAFRPQTRKLERFLNYYQQGNWKKLLIESFIGSREFTYQKQHLAKANIHTVNNSEKGLLAIIDFLNHRVGDGGYIVNSKLKAMEIVGTPDEDSKELCVQYGVLDPFLTYFIYGFVDTSAPFIYSGKCEIELLAGTKLVVLSMSGALKRTSPLPNHISHLKNYLPPGIKKQGDIIIISDLLFPESVEIELLNEVVKQILVISGQKDIYQTEKNFNNEVVHIVSEICKKNIQFWQDLILLSKTLNIVNHDLSLLAQHSIRHFSAIIEQQ